MQNYSLTVYSSTFVNELQQACNKEFTHHCLYHPLTCPYPAGRSSTSSSLVLPPLTAVRHQSLNTKPEKPKTAAHTTEVSHSQALPCLWTQNDHHSPAHLCRYGTNCWTDSCRLLNSAQCAQISVEHLPPSTMLLSWRFDAPPPPRGRPMRSWMCRRQQALPRRLSYAIAANSSLTRQIGWEW